MGVDSSILLIIPLDQLNDTNFVSGSAILIAALLRSFSGALLPWTVEEAPELIQSFYIATGSDADAFAQILRVSAKLKASTSFGGVWSGELLGGKYLDVSIPFFLMRYDMIVPSTVLPNLQKSYRVQDLQ
jgi:hypothetical protein